MGLAGMSALPLLKQLTTSCFDMRSPSVIRFFSSSLSGAWDILRPLVLVGRALKLPCRGTFLIWSVDFTGYIGLEVGDVFSLN